MGAKEFPPDGRCPYGVAFAVRGLPSAGARKRWTTTNSASSDVRCAALPSHRDHRRVLARQASTRFRSSGAETEPVTPQAAVSLRGSDHDGKRGPLTRGAASSRRRPARSSGCRRPDVEPDLRLAASAARRRTAGTAGGSNPSTTAPDSPAETSACALWPR